MDDLTQRLQAALGEAYVVERTLGEGGFAVVYLVRDVKLKRKLAVKVLSPDLITSKSVLDRFQREAETVAQLSHPNIVPLHFIGQKDDLLYLAMQYVDGGSLADRLEKEGKLPVNDVTLMMTEVASALEHAHKRGVVHRDIKPQNVLIDGESGRCLVTDFGIARTADSGSLTATGMVMGTPTYLAPEQVTGEPTDHRVDIYALGVMAYEMLAGRPPFEGPNATAVMMKRLAGPPDPVTKVRAEVPRALQDVITVCLAAEPAERFQTAADVVRALGGRTPTTGAQQTAEIARLQRTRQRRRATIAGTGVAVVALGAWGILALNGRRAAPVKPAVDAEMVLVPSGTYTVGFDGANAGTASPKHTLTLKAFGIDRTEVTVGAYKADVDSGQAQKPWGEKAPDLALPVTGVRWQEASNYCRRHHPETGRLPTEEEWEAAARGLEGRLYPWGAQFDPSAANTEGAQKGAPSRVGSFPGGATPSGVQDLIGNVWEWTSSQPVSYNSAATPADSTYRVIRGGAYNTPDSIATVWRRVQYPLTTGPDALKATGFRCAMTPRTSGSASP